MLLHSGDAADRYSLPQFDYRANTASHVLNCEHLPDVYQGYGAVLLANILPLVAEDGESPELDLVVWDALSLHEHSALMWEVTYRDPSYASPSRLPLKVTIAWYDPPSPSALVSSLLLHDLDLLVEAPNGTVFWGNGVVGGDERNPNEQVHILATNGDGTGAGEAVFRIIVQSHALPLGAPQTFAIVITTSGTTGPPPPIVWNVNVLLRCQVSCQGPSLSSRDLMSTFKIRCP